MDREAMDHTRLTVGQGFVDKSIGLGVQTHFGV
jgi:hypothetical protein